MRKIFLFVLLLTLVYGCGGGGSLPAPSGAVITITPSGKTAEPIEITSSSAVQKSIVQLYQISVKDSDLAGARGIRNTIFNITFELTNVPGTINADLQSLVTMCDGSVIINSLAERTTDDGGNYNICLVYKVGGGLNYKGNLRIMSGTSNATSLINITATPSEMKVTPPSLTMLAGNTGQFTITGGSPEYTITSSNPSILPIPSIVTASSGTFRVTLPESARKGDSDITFTVRDSAGATNPVTVTVGDPPSPVVVPATMSIAAGRQATFSVSGGTPGYTIHSSDNSVRLSTSDGTTNTGSNLVLLPSSGDTFIATVPSNMAASAVTFTILDSAGMTATATLNITAFTKANQTIIFNTAPNIIVGGTGTVSATGGASGQPIVFKSLTASVCSINGTTVTGLTAGTCTIAADQAGTANYNAAPQATQSFTINTLTQTISFGAAPSVIVGGTGTVVATATSGLTVSLTSLTHAVCTISGTTVTGVSAGTCRIAADQAGNERYSPATQVVLTFTITP